jgi:ATP-dependent helicase/nuclease subunit A
MTRAADRLIIGGCMPGNMNNVRKLCWYDLIAKGLAASGLCEETVEATDGMTKRYRLAVDAGDGGSTDAAAAEAPAPVELPSWLRMPVDVEAAAAPALHPSDGGGVAGRRFGGGEQLEARARAIQRGTLVHRLLQSLPEVQPSRRREIARTFLARNAETWSEVEREGLAAKVLAVIAEPRFAPVFADGSRAEVAIVGRLERRGGRSALVSGQIDRLVVTAGEVLIVDFKTNQAPPKTAAEAPEAYVRQLALYRAVLQKLYPNKPVRAALLWTESVELMEISASALDAGLPSPAA